MKHTLGHTVLAKCSGLRRDSLSDVYVASEGIIHSSRHLGECCMACVELQFIFSTCIPYTDYNCLPFQYTNRPHNDTIQLSTCVVE